MRPTVPADNRDANPGEELIGSNIRFIVHGNKDILVLPINALIPAGQLLNAQANRLWRHQSWSDINRRSLFLAHAKLFIDE
jgi:hypothetical protein